LGAAIGGIRGSKRESLKGSGAALKILQGAGPSSPSDGACWGPTLWGLVMFFLPRDDFFVDRTPESETTYMNQARARWLRRPRSILPRTCRTAAGLRFPIVSLGLPSLPCSAPEELQKGRIEARWASSPAPARASPTEEPERARVDGIRQEAVDRLLAAAMGLIPWNTRRRP
jgi:hypothetical protein